MLYNHVVSTYSSKVMQHGHIERRVEHESKQ